MFMYIFKYYNQLYNIGIYLLATLNDIGSYIVASNKFSFCTVLLMSSLSLSIVKVEFKIHFSPITCIHQHEHNRHLISLQTTQQTGTVILIHYLWVAYCSTAYVCTSMISPQDISYHITTTIATVYLTNIHCLSSVIENLQQLLLPSGSSHSSYIHTHMHTHPHTHTCARVHTHTHTHTYTRPQQMVRLVRFWLDQFLSVINIFQIYLSLCSCE